MRKPPFRLVLAALSMVPLRAAATVYHPEVLGLGRNRVPLIDCGKGFRPALLDLFHNHARDDGLRVADPARLEVQQLDREAEHWIGRFRVSDGAHTFSGFIFVEPPVDDGDDGDDFPNLPSPAHRMCSAVFADDAATKDELAQIEKGYARFCRKFGVSP